MCKWKWRVAISAKKIDCLLIFDNQSLGIYVCADCVFNVMSIILFKLLDKLFYFIPFKEK